MESTGNGGEKESEASMASKLRRTMALAYAHQTPMEDGRHVSTMPNNNDEFMRMKCMAAHATMSASHIARLDAGLGGVSDRTKGIDASNGLLARIMGGWERVASAVCLLQEAQVKKRVSIRGGGERRENSENEGALGAASDASGAKRVGWRAGMAYAQGVLRANMV